MKKQMTVRKTVLAALFLAIGLILPFITMQIPAVGKMLCPMHIPVLLCNKSNDQAIRSSENISTQ